ncbi:hypothetical protein V1264_021422 [Littorina saxatilis]|uniref:Uncharacterized protein n=1 Tax=Littorina saxatilis TaxID=31220 RepID=A0AAN9AI51_9CAEN
MATESSQLSEIDYLRKNYLLLQKVCREFDVAARQLDSTKDKIRVARVAGVGAATVGAVTAFATGGAGAVATVGDVASMVYALSGIVEDILNSQELKGLERNWSQVKKMYTSEFDIPRRNKDAIADWARGNLPRDQARAVIRAIEKCTSDLRSPERLKHLDSRNLKALLESPLLLVAADFSVFEILLAAAKEKDEPVDVQRFLQRLRKYQQILKQRFERTAGRGSITGAQDIRGLWRIYPTTQAARNELLIKERIRKETRQREEEKRREEEDEEEEDEDEDRRREEEEEIQREEDRRREEEEDRRREEEEDRRREEEEEDDRRREEEEEEDRQREEDGEEETCVTQ